MEMNSIIIGKNYGVRIAQSVQQFGTGAMIDFQKQTLMTAAPKFWYNPGYEIHDERLEYILGVSKFVVPSSTEEGCLGLSYVRFPEWYFCPKCRRIQPLKKWIDEHKRFRPKTKDPEMVRSLRCHKCNRDLVVSRFVSVCENGHIDDFPWVEWAHVSKGKVCSKPDIKFLVSNNAADGMGGLAAKCETCGAYNNLAKAFYPEILMKYENDEKINITFKCKGKHPWNHSESKSCGKIPRIQQRGGSSVYFSNVESSLSIPPFSSKVTQKIINNDGYKQFVTFLDGLKTNTAMLEFFKNDSANMIKSYVDKIHDSTGIEIEYIQEVLNRKLKGDSEGKADTSYSVEYRYEEYTALNGTAPSMKSIKCGDDFIREATNIDDYSLPGIKGIHLIKRLREIRVLTGFSRLSPAKPGDESKGFVSIIDKNFEWYPAYEVRGEGIFIEFKLNEIEKWIKNNEVISTRIGLLEKNKNKSNFNFSKSKRVTAKFVFLHTLSHLLIKQMSYECGYDISSLKERIYCSDKDEGAEMQGILIYTANGDSEGTLGGLVRLGYSDVFPGIFRKAVEKSIMCSNDPICSFSEGQGLDSLNISACYSCALLPETSCEEYNVFLDRAFVIGTPRNQMSGFYSKNVYVDKGWYADFKDENDKDNDAASETINETAKQSVKVISQGKKLTKSDYETLWEDLSLDTSNKTEAKLLEALHNINNSFSRKEVPYESAELSVDDTEISCDLLWPQSKVIYFSAEYEEEYNKIKNSEWKCFCGSDDSLKANDLLQALQEEI